jgi:hypothetical protein
MFAFSSYAIAAFTSTGETTTELMGLLKFESLFFFLFVTEADGAAAFYG